MKRYMMAAALILLPGVAAGQYYEALSGNIRFGSRGCQKLYGGVPSGSSTRMSCKRSGNCLNDEYASVILLPGVKNGTIIRLFDDPDGKRSDDWVEIRVRNLPAQGRTCIESLERSVSNSMYTETYSRKNGLNGKVSFVEVIVPR